MGQELIPSLPEGFQLEGNTPPLPPGFQIENAGVKSEKIGAVEDSIKSGLTGLRKGLAANILGAPGDIYSLLSAAAEWGATKISDATGLPKGGELAKKIGGIIPTSDDFIKFYEANGSRFHKPETSAGRYTKAITEGAAGNIIPGMSGVSNMAKMGAAGGVGGEIAADLTEDNPIGRVVGSVVGTALAGGPKAMSKNSGKMVREATEDLTPQHWAAALKAQEQAKSVGVPLMGPESLPQGSIQQLASDVAASKTGGRVVGKFIDKRPAQVEKSVGKFLDKTGVEEVPSVTINRAQEAATDIISDAEKSRTAAASPYYKAVQNYSISTDQQLPIYQSIDDAIAKSGSSDIQKKIQGLQSDINSANGNVGKLDDVVKFWRGKVENTSINADPLDKQAAKFINGVLKQVETQIGKASPELAQGKRVHQQRTQMHVDPLIQGDIGKVAGKGYDPQITPPMNRVLSIITDEKTARPLTIRNAYLELNQKDKKAFPQVVRLWLENSFNEAAKDVQSGPNRMIGANFKKAVYGDPKQRLNFMEAIAGVADANGVNKSDLQRGAVTLLDTLEKTGKIPNIGSPTGGRIETNNMARQSRIAGTLETVSSQPLGPVAKVLRDMANRNAYKELAEAFTDPNSVQKLLALSKLTPQSNKAQLLVAELLSVNRALSNAGADDTADQEKENNR